MNPQMPDFLEYARERAELSEGTAHEWNYRECKYCLMDFAKLRLDRLNWSDIIDEFEALPR